MRLARVLPAAALVLASLAGAGRARAQDSLAFTRSEVMIPMRDGVRLHAVVLAPPAGTEPLPLVLTRTPYGVTQAPRLLQAWYQELARDGYIFVFEDIRGRYGSEGQFLMNRPLHDPGDANGVDETTDTYDTVEWLLHHVPGNNGRVGVIGVSYPGWLAAMAGIHPHPAVKAVSPQAPMTDTWMGDDFFHYGAFRLSYGFEYASEMELTKDMTAPPPVGSYDTYAWYLRQGPLANLTTALAGRVPTWTNFTKHPTYDAFWKARALTGYLTELRVPTLTVGGWYDQEDFYGPLATYRALERHDTAGINMVVLGPWNHGGWSRGPGRTLGPIDFGSATGQWYREQVQAPWFAWRLKDRGNPDLPEALAFEGGSNRWRRFASWPPKEATPRNLYFLPGGRLAFDPPTAKGGAFDQYVSDPAHPVPYRPRPVQVTYSEGSKWYDWQVQDQRFVDGRPDVLAWQTEPLAQDVTIAGDISAHLFASTTGTDADWVVKLIDVFPDSGVTPREQSGYEFMVAGEILRGRYRQGFDRPAPIVPGRVAAYTVDLHQQSYRFRAGHRIMVQVQSTWFPVYDRNPQTYVPNIFEAKASDFRARTHRIWRTAAFPSHVRLPVLPE